MCPLFYVLTVIENRYVLRHISNMNFNFGQSGMQREKKLICHKYAIFEASSACFYGQKKILKKPLHSYVTQQKGKTNFKNLRSI